MRTGFGARIHAVAEAEGFPEEDAALLVRSFLSAGVDTTIFGMPNLNPPTTSVETLTDVFDRYARTSIVDWNHNPAPTQFDHIQKMAEMGINAYKIYMVVDTGRTYPHPAGTGMHDHGTLLKMMDHVAKTGKRFIVHPHDQSLMDYIEGEILGRGEDGLPPISLSCGVAFGDDSQDTEAIFKRADTALYAVKGAGGHGCRVG